MNKDYKRRYYINSTKTIETCTCKKVGCYFRHNPYCELNTNLDLLFYNSIIIILKYIYYSLESFNFAYLYSVLLNCLNDHFFKLLLFIEFLFKLCEFNRFNYIIQKIEFPFTKVILNFFFSKFYWCSITLYSHAETIKKIIDWIDVW